MDQKTLGESRVRTSFNPSSDGTVDQIKQKAAELINLVEGLRTTGIAGEKARLISLAQTDIESAAMWAVKAATC
ncbi:hypothetical protein LZD49_28515 [Dyadobacter sp. CY261]|uniref:Acb2/Tad1 domain-containing protein n=1 Tax=Dyadobacter sp. CY261 TaxID=2907203 RepID=UPI001F47AD9F|nr:hypothetical protein [Dyadobacter sp. CY261]MCF0074462.1 hypothetical protein [Dyadobacter sp. CY261]